MKKVTSLALAGLMAVSSVAVASEVRENSFGQGGIFVDDVHQMWWAPTQVLGNGDTTYLDFAAGMGGVHFNLGPGVLAIWGNRTYGLFSDINGGFTAPNQAPTGALAGTAFGTPSQQIDLIYGVKISDTLGLALGVNRASVGTSTEITNAGVTTKTSSNNSDLGVNVGADISGGLVKVGIQYVMENGETTNNNATVTNKNARSGSDLTLSVAGTINSESKSFHKYIARFRTESLSLETKPSAATPANTFVKSDNTGTAWGVGYAMGMSNENGMGLGGLILSGGGNGRTEPWNTAEVNKRDSNNMKLGLVTAAEGKLKEWLSLRAGVSSTLWGTTSVTTEVGAAGSTLKTTTVTESAAGTALSMGAALHFGSVTLDGLYTNGNQAGGGLDGAMFSQVSLTWGWGGAKE